MSNRPCNYCEFLKLKTWAKSHHLIVTTKESTPSDLEQFMEGQPGTDVFIDGEWSCWYMYLPDHCEC